MGVLLPSMLVVLPSELWPAPLLILLEVVPPSELQRDLPWALSWGPPLDLDAYPALALALLSEIRKHLW